MYKGAFRGHDMNDEFFKDRAKIVRAIAETADRFTRIRLLELADRYERKPRKPTPLPSIPVKDAMDGGRKGVT